MPNRKEPLLDANLDANSNQQPDFQPTSTQQASSQSADIEPTSFEPTDFQQNSYQENDFQQSDYTKQPPQPRASKLALFSLILVVLSLALSAYLWLENLQLQQEHAKAIGAIDKLAARMQEVEILVAETGDDLSATGTSFNQKLEWADAEIRKLWVVAHQKNRPNIEKLQQETAAFKASLAEQKTSLDAQKASFKNQQVATEKQQQEFKNYAQQLKELEIALGENSLATSTLRQSLQDQDVRPQLEPILKQLPQLEQKLSQLQKEFKQQQAELNPDSIPENLSAKLAEQAEVLKSLEASRAQLTQRITRLMEDVNQLQQSTP